MIQKKRPMTREEHQKRALVAIGRKFPQYHTIYVTYSSREPSWLPTPDPQAGVDEDELRHAELESNDDI
jgi:hypothetical protein